MVGRLLRREGRAARPVVGYWRRGAGPGPGSEIDRDTHRQVIADHIEPRDGKTRLGRSPGNAAARTEALYQEKLRAAPHATFKRQFELRREAAREAGRARSTSSWTTRSGGNARGGGLNVSASVARENHSSSSATLVKVPHAVCLLRSKDFSGRIDP